MKFNIKNVLLGIIIAVVFLMFAVYGTKLIYDAPEYEDFCGNEKFVSYDTQEDCEANDGKWGAYEGREPKSVIEGGVSSTGYCDIYFNCREELNAAQEAYSRNLFLISLIFGILVIVVSVLFVHVDAVSGGLMFGSLMFIIYGTGSYWRYMNDWLRFVLLGVSLVILIYLGYRLASRDNKK